MNEKQLYPPALYLANDGRERERRPAALARRGPAPTAAVRPPGGRHVTSSGSASGWPASQPAAGPVPLRDRAGSPPGEPRC